MYLTTALLRYLRESGAMPAKEVEALAGLLDILAKSGDKAAELAAALARHSLADLTVPKPVLRVVTNDDPSE